MTFSRPTILTSGLCTLVLLTSTALPGAAKDSAKEIPFKGYLQGTVRGVPQGPTTISVEGNDTGLSGELGQFKITYRFTITIPPDSGPGDPSTSAGTAEWIIANGDTIYTKFVGIGEPTDTFPIVRVVEYYQVTGGTGKFSNAKGQFTVKRLSSADPSSAANLTSGGVEGIIKRSQSGR
jgi:hypothetical protein